MAVDLFAGIPVTDYAAALPWYERFFGGPPSFLPNDTEAVWEVAEHRYIYIVQESRTGGERPGLVVRRRPRRAGRRHRPAGRRAWQTRDARQGRDQGDLPGRGRQ